MTETLKERIEKLPRYGRGWPEQDGRGRPDGKYVRLDDVLSALAGIACQQDEKDKNDHTRVVSQPSAAHGDLPRPATSPFGETLPGKIRAIIADESCLTVDDIERRPGTERYYRADCIESILALLDGIPLDRHARNCPAYSNYQPPYEDCTCGYEEQRAAAGIVPPSEQGEAIAQEKEKTRPSGASKTEQGSPSRPLRAIE